MILDVTDPTAPVFVGQTEVLEAVINDVAVAGSHAYLATDRLLIVDISDPVHPVQVGALPYVYSTLGVTVSGSYAYLAASGDGLKVVNVIDPTHPTLSGSVDTPGWASDVAVAGAYAYVVDADGGMRVIGVANPAHPTEVGSYTGYASNQTAQGVAVAGSYAYLTDMNEGLRIVSVSDPAHPSETGVYPIDVGPYNVAIANARRVCGRQRCVAHRRRFRSRTAQPAWIVTIPRQVRMEWLSPAQWPLWPIGQACKSST